jgi:CRISPR/Cas system-associated protein Csm6
MERDEPLSRCRVQGVACRFSGRCRQAIQNEALAAVVSPAKLKARIKERERDLQNIAKKLAEVKPFDLAAELEELQAVRGQMENDSTLVSAIGIFWEAASGRSYLSCAMQSHC